MLFSRESYYFANKLCVQNSVQTVIVYYEDPIFKLCFINIFIWHWQEAEEVVDKTLPGTVHHDLWHTRRITQETWLQPEEGETKFVRDVMVFKSILWIILLVNGVDSGVMTQF